MGGFIQHFNLIPTSGIATTRQGGSRNDEIEVKYSPLSKGESPRLTGRGIKKYNAAYLCLDRSNIQHQ